MSERCVGRARRREHVDAGARQHVAGDADDLVDAHRHGAHALGNHRRQSGAGFLRRQLRGEDRLVLDDRRRSRRGRRSRSAVENAPSGAWPAGNGTTFRSSALSSAPSCRSALATTTGCVCMVDRRRRLVVHHVVGAVRQAASGEDGDGEDGKDSVAHMSCCPLTLSFRMRRDAARRERACDASGFVFRR